MNKHTIIEKGLPIYEAIKKRIREKVLTGELKPGDRIPSEHQLARELQVSRNQTRQALRDLQMEGILERSQGRGSFVAHPRKREVGYVGKRTKTVMLAYPRFSSHGQSLYFQRLLRGFSDKMAETGFEAVFHYLDLQQDSELRFLRGVRLSEVRGLALMPHSRSQSECDLVESLFSSHFPCVLFDHSLPDVHVDFVGTANRHAYQQLTEELIARGHSVIGYVAYVREHSTMEERIAGYRRGLERAHIPYREELLIDRNIQEEDRNFADSPATMSILKKLLTQEAPPTAFLCSEGVTARFLAGQVEAHGLRVPDDLEIATIDDDVDEGQQSNPPWLTMVQKGYEIGQWTADLLLARIADPGKNVEHHFIDTISLFKVSSAEFSRTLRKKEKTKEVTAANAV